MKTRKLGVRAVIACILLCLMFPGVAYASDGEDYITISVAATDDNEQLQYALDTDDPSAFSDSNEFAIPAGTSHTIYVKDVAGNITSQTYHPDNSDNSDDTDEQKINIDLEIGGNNKPDYSNYEYLTDDPIEPGTGTVAEKINTDASNNDAERIFYTVTTKEGEVLYMVIDQSRSSDNVYLLDTVSVSDLLALADGNGSAPSTEKEDNLLSALANEENVVVTETKTTEKESSGMNPIVIIVFIVLAGGVYYYFKIYKNKKDESMDIIDDAMDMDEFEAEEDDEVEFDIDDAEKEKFLEELINGEDETPDLLDADPDTYAESSGEDESGYGDFFGDEDLEEVL